MEKFTDDTPIAFLSVGQLKEIIRKELGEKEPSSKPKALRENMSADEAVKMLNENGYSMTKSTLYYKTGKRLIPHSKFGKTLVFSEKELIEWAESKTSKKRTHGKY